MSEDVERKEYEVRLQARVKHLAELFEAGKIHISEHLREDTEKSLLAVRVGPNGEVNLDTVDGRVRSLALGAEMMTERNELKEAASIQDISSNFFDFIEGNLGWIVKEAKKLEMDASEASFVMSKHGEFVSDLAPRIPEFIAYLEGFWEAFSDSAHYNIQDLSGSKAVFGGDLFPSHTSNLCSTSGLYLDTIVLTDPFYQSRHIFNGADPASQVKYLVKHAINLLNYREVALADLPVPLVAFAPFRSSVDNVEMEFLQNIAQRDGLTHASKVFGREFKSVETLFEFASQFPDAAAVAAAVSDEERVLFDLEDKGSVEERISSAFESEMKHLVSPDMSPGALVAINGISRMGQATDILLKSNYLGGTPLIQAETSWQYFKWKLEYNSTLDKEQNDHMHMSQGLMRAEQTDETWLGNIPTDALIEMRKTGAFEEIRSVLSEGVNDLAMTNPDNFFRTSDRIVDNIRNAFEAHQAEVKSLTNKKVRFAGHDIAAMVVAGGLDLAAIASGIPSIGGASYVANQALDLPKWKEIPGRFKEIRDEARGLKRSPMGMFFEHKPKN